jgi:hypothetical protein
LVYYLELQMVMKKRVSDGAVAVGD